MIIPVEHLSEEARRGLVDEYCIRETGCNETEDPLEECRHHVESALAAGRLVVLYTPYNPNQVASLVPAEQLEEKDKVSVTGDEGDVDE